MKLNFDKLNGLVPAIIQDVETSKVLMLGFMNEDALRSTQIDRTVTFYSRSKGRLWKKGEESGNFLQVAEILSDCDSDTLLIKVHPSGPVCHTGNDTCWNEQNQRSPWFFIEELEHVILDRKNNLQSESYTSSLFSGGINKIAQKVGEEAIELIIEAKDGNDDLFLNEAADLLFHYMVLLRAKNKSIQDVVEILRMRK